MIMMIICVILIQFGPYTPSVSLFYSVIYFKASELDFVDNALYTFVLQTSLIYSFVVLSPSYQVPRRVIFSLFFTQTVVFNIFAPVANMTNKSKQAVCYSTTICS